MKKESLRVVKWGVVFSLLTLLFGFGLGMTFGAAEETLKHSLNSSAQEVISSVYNNDTDKAKAIVNKSWVYFKRAHLHANGLGTTSLVICLLLSSLFKNLPLRTFASFSLGLGSLLYSIFWLLAGINAPELGSTGAAKEALSFIAIPGSTLCVIGLLITIYLTVTELIISKR